MITAIKIEIHRAEGARHECVTVTFEGPGLWARANATLRDWSRTAPEGGGYDKCDLRITWSDGDTYTGRLDITHEGDDTDVAMHVRSLCEAYSLRKLPPHLAANEERAAMFRARVERDPELKASAERLLDLYQIGDAA